MEGFRVCFDRILEMLQTEFSRANRVFLNPILSHPRIVLADADLVIDETLYDIKTVKDPAKSIRDNKDQVLGYVSLAECRRKDDMEQLDLGKLASVGFVFPLALNVYSVEIPDFDRDARFEFCAKLTRAVEELRQETVNHSKRLQTRR
jgi:hypothetical protein